jgi:hypothetical protein
MRRLVRRLCVFVFWREPDARDTCANIARYSPDAKSASSDMGMKMCVDSMSKKAYGFNAKRRLASYRRCLHGAESAAELKGCESETR